jgi:hypothetical protein
MFKLLPKEQQVSTFFFLHLQMKQDGTDLRKAAENCDLDGMGILLERSVEW